MKIAKRTSLTSAMLMAVSAVATATHSDKAMAICTSPTHLEGRWLGTDGGVYYLREFGNQVFWLGMSPDNGVSWTNVFSGVRNGPFISGEWADVPRGRNRLSGRLNLYLTLRGLEIDGITQTFSTGGFGTRKWDFDFTQWIC